MRSSSHSGAISISMAPARTPPHYSARVNVAAGSAAVPMAFVAGKSVKTRRRKERQPEARLSTTGSNLLATQRIAVLPLRLARALPSPGEAKGGRMAVRVTAVMKTGGGGPASTRTEVRVGEAV